LITSKKSCAKHISYSERLGSVTSYHQRQIRCATIVGLILEVLHALWHSGIEPVGLAQQYEFPQEDFKNILQVEGGWFRGFLFDVSTSNPHRDGEH